MRRQSILVLLIIATALQPTEALAKKRCLYGVCSYTGDPHLTPYPAAYSGPQDQYLCQTPGWEVLSSNAKMSIYVLVGASPYWIFDYVLIFHGPSPCIVIGSSPSPPVCAVGTPASSAILTAGASWTHQHNTECIIVNIEKWSTFYNIHIYQSFALIAASRGVCHKWNCSKEGIHPRPLPIVIKVCDVFVNAAKQRAIGEVDPKAVERAQIACVYDVQTTFDARAGRTAVGRVIQDGAESMIECDDPRKLFAKAESLRIEAMADATKQVNELIASTKDVCDDQNQCLRPIRETDKAEQ